ncbi:MAG TPA: S1 RNA-binding domain-containing protein, partial [Lutibacter sp.]|nr:S1 RNA-binding domain-containing protein [Lutibacter sp.]
ELEEGIDGLVYISDLSWTKKIKHPSDFVSVGDKLEVQVLELDVEGRKLNLGHKQTNENPWDAHEEKFAIDSIHEGTVKDKSDKGLIVGLEEGVEAFVPSRFIIKEDGSKLAKGDVAQFKVIEFNKEFRRIVASHTSIFKAQEEKNVKAAQQKSVDTGEKTTLGDIGGDLAALKKKMEGGK